MVLAVMYEIFASFCLVTLFVQGTELLMFPYWNKQKLLLHLVVLQSCQVHAE